jgi:putative phosphoesterase
MGQRILLISDIHGNYPALTAIGSYFATTKFDKIINCGDSTVYAPFPNETINWLRENEAISILGNTDKKVIKLLKGKSFKKPGKEDKRIMYDTTAKTLTRKNRSYLIGLPKKDSWSVKDKGSKTITIGIFHGSPAENHEFLFNTTPDERFRELTKNTDADIVVTGHSHTPYHKIIDGVHFINPGSAGRMFDGCPDSSCAVLHISARKIQVAHYRVPYDINMLTDKIRECQLPDIYSAMFRQGRKLN